jgi:predicted subunit of tRNA(5-methylaminomethyl-2-thiouridylate) methyltransferase
MTPAVAALFSAGKDSALAGALLDPVYDVVCCHCTFDIQVELSLSEADPQPPADTVQPATGTGHPPASTVATRAAETLGYPLATVELDAAVAEEAVERMVDDGYPRAGIQRVHEHALETVASRERVAGRRFTTVADGTRRDDRVPAVDRSVAQSLEDRHGVDYVRPLAGYGRGAVDDLVDRLFAVETGPSEELATADYETELRALMAAEHGPETVRAVFPEHTQSRVVGRRE